MRVARYLLWRAVRGVLTVLVMVAVTFVLYFAVETQPPVGNFFPDVARGTPATHAQTEEVRHLMYLDRSKLELYVDYVAHLARGDLGHVQTIRNGEIIDAGPVAPVYTRAFRQTLSIVVGGVALVVLLSMPLGAVAGSRIGSWADRLISLGALILVCAHPMMLGLILKSIAGPGVTWADGYCPLFRGPADTCGGAVAWSTHLLLPWLTFGLLFLALYTRMVRASVAETIQEDFVRTARAKGASQSRVIARHVLPSASVRVLTMVGMEIGTAIGVCIYIESAYHIDGLAHEAVQVIGGAGAYLVLPAALAVVVLITLVVVVGNLVVDVFCALLDPRIALHRDPQRTKSFAGGVF